MKKIIDKLNEALLPHNLECDGSFCMSCWKDVIRDTIKMLEEYNEKEPNCDHIDALQKGNLYVTNAISGFFNSR